MLFDTFFEFGYLNFWSLRIRILILVISIYIVCYRFFKPDRKLDTEMKFLCRWFFYKNVRCLLKNQIRTFGRFFSISTESLITADAALKI